MKKLSKILMSLILSLGIIVPLQIVKVDAYFINGDFDMGFMEATNRGCLDDLYVSGTTLRMRGWHLFSFSPPYSYMFVIDARTGLELARYMYTPVSRPDVSAAYGDNRNFGFDLSVNTSKFRGKTVWVMSRKTGNKTGDPSNIGTQNANLYWTSKKIYIP